MTATKQRHPRKTIVGKRQTKKTATPALSGEVTYVRIPVPPRSAMNRKRPISDLVKAQLVHIHHAEKARLPEHKRDDRQVKKIRTEAQAASYIAKVTKVLHPQRKPGSDLRTRKRTK